MGRKVRQWTPEEDAAIRSYPEKSLNRLAFELKTGQGAIKHRLGELGLSIRKPGRPRKPGKPLPLRDESDFGSDEHYYGTDKGV